ncbi:tRNA threonylcarbamoyladenosine dehydratase [Veillonella agrestimuris]|uniref:tRNA threonylcarbamoyladenosine dehydratase n=1 Tax=Veillonella agrestimuris TaxID=2941340 RepID=UPI00203B61AE|nr:tRNA threonylcarbamoyladenosine dehydratase [Veillonella agrestimuris]
MEYLLTRLEWLVGPDKINTLKHTSVALFGVGGVGGGALEALVRAGVGRIVLIDGDSVAPSNLNRQMITTNTSIGRRKVEVAKERALAINPEVIIEAHDIMYTDEAYPGFIESLKVDFVIDAIDMVTAKLDVIEICQAKGIPVISSMGGGNRFYPEKLEIADINKTFNDPLARVMRKELRKRGIKKQLVVFSREVPTKPEFRDEGRSPGTCSFVPPVAGFLLAAHVLRTILEVPKQ